MMKRQATKKQIEQKQPKNTRRTYLIDGLVVLAVLGSIAFAVFGRDRDTNPYACEQPGTNHRLQLANDKFSQASLAINRCDTLTIENKDTLSYNLNFGEYDQHFQYPGYQVVTMIPNESITIDAFTAGEYELHDHFRDNAVLKLTIRDNK